MPNFASCTLIGHLGNEPELKTLNSGEQLCSFSLATSRKRKNEEITTWWRCTMFGKRAAVIAQYLHKGNALMVVGEPVLRPWVDKEGGQRQSLELVLSDFTMLGKQGVDDSFAPPQTKPTAAPQAAFDDDDIPF